VPAAATVCMSAGTYHTIQIILLPSVRHTSGVWGVRGQLGGGCCVCISSELVAYALWLVCSEWLLMATKVSDVGDEVTNGLAWNFFHLLGF